VLQKSPCLLFCALRSVHGLMPRRAGFRALDCGACEMANSPAANPIFTRGFYLPSCSLAILPAGKLVNLWTGVAEPGQHGRVAGGHSAIEATGTGICGPVDGQAGFGSSTDAQVGIVPRATPRPPAGASRIEASAPGHGVQIQPQRLCDVGHSKLCANAVACIVQWWRKGCDGQLARRYRQHAAANAALGGQALCLSEIKHACTDDGVR
jgi:hypothetical protein